MDTKKANELLEAAEREDAEDYPRPKVLAQIERQAPATLAVAIKLAEALEERCWHQELYEERNDGASEIYPDIMHEGKCSGETACEPCSSCQALAAWEALDTPPT